MRFCLTRALHTGDQQGKTNLGGKENDKGKSGKDTTSDGNSYDVDIAWEIGWLEDEEEATLTIYVAPGLNPAGKLEFTSEGCTEINTGPVLRAWDPPEGFFTLKKRDFEFAESFRNARASAVGYLDGYSAYRKKLTCLLDQVLLIPPPTDQSASIHQD